MKKDFIKATCQINNKVVGKVYSPAARSNGNGGSRQKTKPSLHFWKKVVCGHVGQEALKFLQYR